MYPCILSIGPTTPSLLMHLLQCVRKILVYELLHILELDKAVTSMPSQKNLRGALIRK